MDGGKMQFLSYAEEIMGFKLIIYMKNYLFLAQATGNFI
jgi:hypothetical protein